MVSEEKRRINSGKEISTLQLNFQSYDRSYGHCAEMKRRSGNTCSQAVRVAFEMHEGSSKDKLDIAWKLTGKYTKQ